MSVVEGRPVACPVCPERVADDEAAEDARVSDASVAPVRLLDVDGKGDAGSLVTRSGRRRRVSGPPGGPRGPTLDEDGVPTTPPSGVGRRDGSGDRNRSPVTRVILRLTNRGVTVFD